MNKRWRWWIVGVIVIPVALISATGALAMWLHTLVRLSATTAVCDIEPRAAISPDGNWLASVWIQGRKINNGCVNRGAAVLRWATSTPSQTGWSNIKNLALPTAYADGCYVHADIALDGSTAHIAATIWSPCDETNADSAIVHYTCDLSNGTCTPATIVTAHLGSEGLRFSDARIVLDSENRPHIVYGQGDHALAQGKLFYTRKLDSTWSPPQLISPSAETAYHPAVAASNGRIHIVWQRHRDYVDTLGRLRQRGDVRYLYCEEAGDCGNTLIYPSPITLMETTYPVPNVAARGDRVILTWNVCADVDNNPPCEKFYLVYARSDTNGSGFSQPLEVGTEIQMSLISVSTQYYAGSDDANDPAGEYATHLNAAVALDPDELPYLVWQMQQDDGYVLTTTHAISATSQNFTWSQEGMWQFGDGGDNRVYPSLASTTAGDTQALHVIYMQPWRENQWSRSQVYYDAASPQHLTLHLSYTERTNSLPQERAQTITAYVEQEDGTAVNDVPVTFQTTLGSFEYNGYGASQLQMTTDAQGEATLNLYSNQTGTAQVQAWVDSVANVQWDVGEPGAALTQTWVFSGTPALTTLTEPVMSGQWITATASDHPYTDLADPYGNGEPREYYLWWCPVDAPPDLPVQQIGLDFLVDINTWRKDLMAQIPYGANGTYRLETHSDSSGSTPCGLTDSLIAASPVLTVTSDYPPGALVAIDNPRPYPDDIMLATLRNHPDGIYGLWWCTDSGVDIERLVASNVTVASAEKDTTLRVPIEVSGLYHLESHADDPSAGCGNDATYMASSALIWPYSRVFLPLIIRGQ
jgi:hypothetical protein